MTDAPHLQPNDDAITKLAGVTSVPMTRFKKSTRRSSAIRLRTIFQDRGNFATLSVYYHQAPTWGRKLSFREAVLPLMYRVREDGLQTVNASATRSSLVCPRALPSRKPIAWGIFGMSEPIITCPHCKAEVRLTESLAAPLI
jgi:hypothetical protein